MAFPTTSVLDNFNRADENPLDNTGNWRYSVFHSGPESPQHSTFKLVSNAVMDDSTADGGASGQAYWNTSTFGPAVEVYVTLSTVWSAAGSDFWFFIHMTGPDTPGDSTLCGYLAYALYNAGAWRYQINRWDNGVGTEIQSFQIGPTLSAGDKLGFECTSGGQMTWYYKAAAGSWGAASGLSSVTDTTYTTGYIAFEKGYLDTTSVLDDFGGGNIVASVSTNHLGLLLGVGQ